MDEPAQELVLHEVTRRFTGPDGTEFTVLDRISSTVAAAETVAIVGPSGSGKSTLLNLIGGLDTPTSGSIRLGADEVTALTGLELARFRASRVGFVFQEHHLLPQLSAVENVLLPSLALSEGRRDEEWARKLLGRLGLGGRLDAFPGQLSGGERQRVALARALVNGAKLLLCDEPTGNLDAETGAAVVTLLLDVAREESATVLMVTHNAAHARRFGRSLQLREGGLTGTPGVKDGEVRA
ncbi:MAG: ABC transporter ATP-binding protein [Armatimonadetes bacterium]|nr:ABC transporter ATP-binding protein [Armatimonadota bacterium]